MNPGPPAGGATGGKPPKSGYVAFAGKDKVERLRIHRANAPTRSPGYAYLLDVVYDGAFGTNFVLVYTFLMVLVRGRNMQGLVLALETGMATSGRAAVPVGTCFTAGKPAGRRRA